MIPLCDLTRQYRQLKLEIDRVMIAVAEQGRYILGPNVAQLEKEIADYCDCNYAVGVNSGTDALQLALRGLGVGSGDEVITTPFTFIASAEAIRLVGARPVFVDVDPDTYNIDSSRIEAAISPRTKAILPVHLFGQPCDMDSLVSLANRFGLQIVEDCAQAIGATYRQQRVGSFGAAGCFSFFPTKNLGCCGDGGMIVTNDEELYRRLDRLRRHGAHRKYHHDEPGLNSRLDEVQAAILRVKLPHLDVWNERRQKIAFKYNQLLEPFAHINRPAELRGARARVPTNHATDSDRLIAVYHQYTIRVDDRTQVMESLRDVGIETAVYYPVPLHLQHSHLDLGYIEGDCPIAERLAETCLSLPMFPELNSLEQVEIVRALARTATCAV